MTNFLAAFDPGESTGWATFDAKGTLTGVGTCRGRDALYELLDGLEPPEIVVIEEFTLYQSKALQQSGSKMETTRVIGVIENWARSSKVVFQRANIKPIAQLWTGAKPTGSHKNSHHIDAMNHGFYYLIDKGIVKRQRPKDV